VIDIHSHLLPGIDDGPRSWDESIELCRRVAAEGVTLSVATPHLIDGVYNNTRRRVDGLVRELNDRLGDARIALEVAIGAEVDFSSQLIQTLVDELPRIANGKAVLMEMPVAVIPPRIADSLFNVRARGLVPVLAHPERNELLQERPSLAIDWLQAGAALQLDAESLLGLWGRRAKACAETLLSAGHYHAMASDAHSAERRPPRLRDALARAVALVGEDAGKLLDEGPRALIAGRIPDLGLHAVERTGTDPRQVGRSPFVRRITGRWFGR